MRVSQLKSIILLTTIIGFVSVVALSDVNKDCIAENNGETPNDYLLGTWHQIYLFKGTSALPTLTCYNMTFTRPTPEEILAYQERYKKTAMPDPIDENSLLIDDAVFEGMMTGNREAKTYVVAPKYLGILNLDGYEVYVFRRLTDKFALYWDCSMRGNLKWVISRDKRATEEELQEAIKGRPELYNMIGERHCRRV